MKNRINIYKIKIFSFLSFCKKLLKKKNFQKAFLYNHYAKKRVKENYVLYESFHGTIFGGNPYAMFKYLIENDKYDYLYHIITVKDVNHPIALRYKNHPRVKIVKTNSRKFIKYLETSKYIINNTTFRPGYIKREEQFYINTWHATLLKSLGAHTKRVWESRNLTRNFLNSDMIIMPNDYTKNILLEAYYIDELYRGKLTDIGYPRNDLIFNTDKNRVLEIMNVPKGKKVILYAPTWRGEINKPKNVLDEYIKYFRQIKENVNDEYVVYLKLHSMVYRYIKPEEKQFLVPFDVDTNEILAITDILITDYSGIMFDYMNTKKPIVLFQFDIDYYVKDRGDFYLPLSSLPAPIYYDVESVCKAINNISAIEKEYKRKYENFAKKIVYADNGTSCKQLAESVFDNKKNKKIYRNKKVNKKQILFCVSYLNDKTVYNTLLETLNKIDYNKYVVTLLFKDYKVGLNKQLLINKNANLLYIDGDELFDSKEYIDINVFKKTGHINYSIEKNIKNFSYKNVQRYVRNLNFDIMINYCSNNVKFNLMMFFGVKAKRKILIVNKNLEKIKSSKKAYKISAEYYDKTYVYDEKDIKCLEKLDCKLIKLSDDEILKMIKE